MSSWFHRPYAGCDLVAPLHPDERIHFQQARLWFFKNVWTPWVRKRNCTRLLFSFLDIPVSSLVARSQASGGYGSVIFVPWWHSESLLNSAVQCGSVWHREHCARSRSTWQVLTSVGHVLLWTRQRTHAICYPIVCFFWINLELKKYPTVLSLRPHLTNSVLPGRTLMVSQRWWSVSRTEKHIANNGSSVDLPADLLLSN